MISKTFDKGTPYNTFSPSTYADFEMIGKIAYQVIRNVDAKNPLAMFDKGLVDNGDTIEQAIIKLAEEKAYDATGANALNRLSNSDMVVRYFNDWTRTKFDKTIDIAKTRKVILKDGNYDSIVGPLVASLSEGDTQAKYESVKALLAWGITNSAFVHLADVPVTSGGAVDYKGVLKKLKNTIKAFGFNSTSYNVAGIKRRASMEDVYIIAPYSLITDIDVEELAGVFNLDKAEIKSKIVEIDTSDNMVYIVDKNAILVWQRLYEMADQKNADGLFWNYFLHVERLYAISPLFNACYFEVKTSAE